MREQSTPDLIDYDAASYLKPDDIDGYLELAFEDGDPALIAMALGNAIKAIGASEVARRTGLSRESLYRSFGPNGNPTLATLTSVMTALGLKLRVASKRAA